MLGACSSGRRVQVRPRGSRGRNIRGALDTDALETQESELVKVSGDQDPADILTKPVAQATLERHMASLGCWAVPVDANPEGAGSDGGGEGHMPILHTALASAFVACLSVAGQFSSALGPQQSHPWLLWLKRIFGNSIRRVCVFICVRVCVRVCLFLCLQVLLVLDQHHMRVMIRTHPTLVTAVLFHNTLYEAVAYCLHIPKRALAW